MNIVGRFSRIAIAGAVIGALALAGCSSSSKSSSEGSTTTTASGSASGSSAVCQSVEKFKSSLSELTKGATFTSKSNVQTALDSLKASLDDLKSSLKSSDKPKVDALQSSISDLQKAIDKQSGISGLSDVASAGQDVAQSAGAVFDAVKAGCPSS
jgi:peptidoglycan hydrolase CwlO-like protein